MFSAEGFPRPVPVSALEPGDIFIAYFESRSAGAFSGRRQRRAAQRPTAILIVAASVASAHNAGPAPVVSILIYPLIFVVSLSWKTQRCPN